MGPLDNIGAGGVSFKAKYVKRTGTRGKYKYWYRNPKTGALQAGKQPASKKKAEWGSTRGGSPLSSMTDDRLSAVAMLSSSKEVRDSAKKELQSRQGDKKEWDAFESDLDKKYDKLFDETNKKRDKNIDEENRQEDVAKEEYEQDLDGINKDFRKKDAAIYKEYRKKMGELNNLKVAAQKKFGRKVQKERSLN